MKRTLLLILALAINLSAWAYTREIIAVHSPSMGKDVMAAVVLPDNYHQMKDLAVVYLMHGCGDNFHAVNKAGFLFVSFGHDEFRKPFRLCRNQAGKHARNGAQIAV